MLNYCHFFHFVVTARYLTVLPTYQQTTEIAINENNTSKILNLLSEFRAIR